jgi:hypothetical protein
MLLEDQPEAPLAIELSGCRLEFPPEGRIRSKTDKIFDPCHQLRIS